MSAPFTINTKQLLDEVEICVNFGEWSLERLLGANHLLRNKCLWSVMACLQIRGKNRKRACVWKRREFYRGKSDTVTACVTGQNYSSFKGYDLLHEQKKEDQRDTDGVRISV